MTKRDFDFSISEFNLRQMISVEVFSSWTYLDAITEFLDYSSTQAWRCCSKFLFSNILIPKKPLERSIQREMNWRNVINGIVYFYIPLSPLVPQPFRQDFQEFWEKYQRFKFKPLTETVTFSCAGAA